MTYKHHPPPCFSTVDLAKNKYTYHEIHSLLLPICTGASVQNLCVRMVGEFSDTIQTLLSDLNLSVIAALKS